MKKLGGHAIVLWAVLLIVVAVLAVVLPFVHNTVYWTAAVCDLIMFIAVEIIYVRSFRRDDTLVSRILGWPLFKVGIVALFAQIVMGFALMALAGICSFWVALLAEILLFAAMCSALAVRDAAMVIVERNEAVLEDRTADWKRIRQKANAAAAATGNGRIRALAEDIRYADPMPTELDAKMEEAIDLLAADPSEDNIQAAGRLLAQRKELSAASKKRS